MLYSYRTIRHQQLFYSLSLFPSSLQDVEGLIVTPISWYGVAQFWNYILSYFLAQKNLSGNMPLQRSWSPAPSPSPSPNKLTLLRHCYWETKICAYVNCLIYCTDCWNSRILWGKMFPSHKKIRLLFVFICKVLLRRTSSAPLCKTINK